MLVEAMYDNGRLVFDRNFHFAHKRFNVKVELPDAEVVDKFPNTDVAEKARSVNARTLVAELDTIYKNALADTDATDDHITENQQHRWDAADLARVQQ